jgi:predicted kinase
MLVLMTGLPGTGKSAIAEAVAQVLPAAILSADPIDAAIARAGLDDPEGIAGYEAMKALAEEHLRLGLHVVIDAVNPFAWERDEYFEMARRRGERVRVIRTICSDVALHQQRIAERHAAGLKAITWEGVERQIAYYEPYDGPTLDLDAVDDLEANVLRALDYVAMR